MRDRKQTLRFLFRNGAEWDVTCRRFTIKRRAGRFTEVDFEWDDGDTENLPVGGVDVDEILAIKRVK
jgi:hypothetical protein